MLGISNSLRQELQQNGLHTRRIEVKLTQEAEFDFMAMCIRFVKEFETDFKLKNIDKKMTLNEYIAKNFAKFIGGRKEDIESRLNQFVGLLDLWSQSETIHLYKWLFEVNPKIGLISIHNKIIDKFKNLDLEFMLSVRKSLKTVSFPLKDVVDVVGKFIHYKSLRVFIENIEQSQKIKKGGVQDRKVPSVLLLKAALEAEYECGGLAGQAVDEEKTQAEQFRYDGKANNYYLRPKETSGTQASSTLGSTLNPDSIPDVQDVLNTPSIEPPPQDEVKQLTKIAHRYVFGCPQSIDDLRRANNNSEYFEQPLTQNELLFKDIEALEQKHKDALKRNQETDQLYNVMLGKFNDCKQNYFTMGKEIDALGRLTNFLQVYNMNHQENTKTLKGIKHNDLIELRKLKLLTGKCFEKTSQDAKLDDQLVYKFAIDINDYHNDLFKENTDQMFDLLNKAPPVPDQKGLKNARAKVRELKDFDKDSPVKDKGLKDLMEGEDVKDVMAMLQSEYYADSVAAYQKRHESPTTMTFFQLHQSSGNNQDVHNAQPTVHFEEEQLLQYKVPWEILDGMTKLIIRKYLPAKKSSREASASSGSKGSKKSISTKSKQSKTKTKSKSKSVKKKSTKPEIPIGELENQYSEKQTPKHVEPPIFVSGTKAHSSNPGLEQPNEYYEAEPGAITGTKRDRPLASSRSRDRPLESSRSRDPKERSSSPPATSGNYPVKQPSVSDIPSSATPTGPREKKITKRVTRRVTVRKIPKSGSTSSKSGSRSRSKSKEPVKSKSPAPRTQTKKSATSTTPSRTIGNKTTSKTPTRAKDTGKETKKNTTQTRPEDTTSSS